MEEYLHLATSWLANLAEFFAAGIIGLASVQAIFKYILNQFKPERDFKENIRLELGRSLALALEFLLGADILKTAVAPNWHDLGILAAIAILRTALNYFLDKEIANHERRLKDRKPGEVS
jgi:uncharacterized membrane protein